LVNSGFSGFIFLLDYDIVLDPDKMPIGSEDFHLAYERGFHHGFWIRFVLATGFLLSLLWLYI